MPGEGGREGFRPLTADLRVFLEEQLNRPEINLVDEFGTILDGIDPERHREVLDFLFAKDNFMVIRGIVHNLSHFRGIPPMEIIDRALDSRFPGEVGHVDDAILAQAGVDHKQFIQKLRESLNKRETDQSRQSFEEDREIVRTKKEPSPNLGVATLRSLAGFGKKQPTRKEVRMDFDAMHDLLIADGRGTLRSEQEIGGSRQLYELLDWVADWERFLSREVVYHTGASEFHHSEIDKFKWMYQRLIGLCSPEEIKHIADECRAENVVDFVKQFIERGKTEIIGKITEQQREFFEITPKAEVWRYGNIEGMDMEDYLAHLAKRDESSGRLLIHVTKDTLFPKLVEDPKLMSAAAVHINADARPGASHALSKGAKHDPGRSGFEQTFGISVAVHFSFDDALEYPDANFACVFASEALFNNYAYLEMDEHAMREGNDIAFGGLTNDYFGDKTHAIDIKKYGFLMVPVQFGDTELGKKLDERGLRIFYYDGNLENGMVQLRDRIGGVTEKPKLARALKFQRRNGERHELTENNPRYAQVALFNQLKRASASAKRGNNVYPEDESMFYHMGRGGGKGNYFAV